MNISDTSVVLFSFCVAVAGYTLGYFAGRRRERERVMKLGYTALVTRYSKTLGWVLNAVEDDSELMAEDEFFEGHEESVQISEPLN